MLASHARHPVSSSATRDDAVDSAKDDDAEVVLLMGETIDDTLVLFQKNGRVIAAGNGHPCRIHAQVQR